MEKNSYPLSFINKQVKVLLENKMNGKIVSADSTNNFVKYYKLPYFGHISIDVEHKVNTFCKFYSKSFNIKVVLIPLKIDEIFNKKVPVPKTLKSFVLFKFVYSSCNTCYIW